MKKKTAPKAPPKKRARRSASPPPPPAATPMDRLNELGAWMRRVNCVHLIVDGVQIVLGPDLAPITAPGPADEPPTEEGARTRRRLAPPEGDLLFASSGG